MKITMYELLGMIKDGKAPKEIKYNGVVFKNNGCNCYLNEKDNSLSYCVEIPMFLNDEVEIIEEEKKIPEKLDYIHPDIECSYNESELLLRIEANKDKINSIIDYLKSKGE